MKKVSNDCVAFGKTKQVQGWMMPTVGNSSVAHHMTLVEQNNEGSKFWRSACGRNFYSNSFFNMLNPGSYPHCKLCEKKSTQ